MYIYNLLRTLNLEDLVVDIYISKNVSDYDFLNELQNIPNGNISVYAGEIKRFFRLRAAMDIFLLLIKHRYDVVHVNTGNVFFQAMCAVLAKIFFVRKRIAHSHNAFKPSSLKLGIGSVAKKMVYFLRRFIINRSVNVFFACSDYAGIWLFGEKTWRKKGHVQKNGIDPSVYRFNQSDRINVRKTYLIPNDSIVIGLVAYFNAQKNQKYLISVFNEFHKNNKNSYLMLVGEGEKLKELQDYVSSHEMENIIFVGATNETHRFYNAFDVFCMTSLYEGLPFVALEAQTSGLPCVLSDSITDETKITECVKFFSLEKSAKDWACELQEMLLQTSSRNRALYSEVNIGSLISHGYDLRSTVKEIEDIYRS